MGKRAKQPLSAVGFVESCIQQHAAAKVRVLKLLEERRAAVAECGNQVSASGAGKPLTAPTESQVDFWAACYLIPKGTVVSYSVLSRIVQGVHGESYAAARLARAAGSAMARNPLAPVVPCHRVVSSSGALTGYSGEGGVAAKARMLAEEGVPLAATNSSDVVDTGSSSMSVDASWEDGKVLL